MKACFDSSDYILGGRPLACRVAECDRRAGVFGYCKDHVDAHVDAEFAKLVAEGVATEERMSCFSDERQHREYAVLWARSDSRPGLTRPCRDCTPQFRNQQHERGQCAHPETVFIREERRGEGMIGVPLDVERSARWEQALLSQYGPVLDRPAQWLIDEAFFRIDRNRKPVGRPPKYVPWRSC